ncbi:MAG TPA: type I-C CRISPR-associated protein Cas8c/Csd1 [Bacillota bacterium]|nr:type I-C CRISPR-associated protein Cas8c/Csd1 [Bacillota bacterium]HPO97979.1 type I-C CRISPR-associated protein Cas8c/Csd1 [Bacillota bacterium]
MIISALYKYYQILASDEKSDIPLYGYCSAKVGFALIISKTGELLDVISLKVEDANGKKLVNRQMIVPEQVKRAANISPNFICDNSTYVLGIDNKDKPDRSKEAFEAYKDLHNRILGSSNSQGAKAILNFLSSWNVDEARQHLVLKECLDEILEGSNLIFKLDGEKGFIHNDLEVKRLWEQHISEDKDDLIGQCLITGEKNTIARLHPNIKNVKNAKPSGASIVSFNAPSYESYGKSQSYNSPISKNVAFAYTTVLNYMLSGPKQKVQIGDATTVFWAESPENIYPDLAAELFNPFFTQEGKEKNVYRRDPKIENLVKDILLKAKSGSVIGDVDGVINPQVRFYVLGLSPNASRISVRFFHCDSFGGFVRKVAQHYNDMETVKEYENQPFNIPIWKILSETVSPKSNNKEANPLLAGSLMRAILNGGLYPAVLFQEIMIRVKTDSEVRVNYIRASIIKAYLIRKARIKKIQKLEEVLTVALNEQTTDKSYLLGRLFAILEKTQKDAGNDTLRARYFTSAMTTPSAVFPILIRLAQHHIAKEEYGYINDKKIELILKDIDRFPSHLTLDEQGVFTLGYYHQRAKLWERQSKENSSIKEEN